MMDVGEADLCSICLSAVTANSESVMPLNCGHAFHAVCLASHIKAQCQEAGGRAEAEIRASEVLRGAEVDLMSDSSEGSLQDLARAGRIRQCPQCGYGPVTNLGCSDMRSHDAQRGRGTARTTNSCPRCQFFSDSWFEWHVWDPTSPASAVSCPCCRTACCIVDNRLHSLNAGFNEAEQELRKRIRETDSELAQTDHLFVLLLFLQARIQKAKDPQASLFQSSTSAWSRLYRFEAIARLAERPGNVEALLGSEHFCNLLARRLKLAQESTKSGQRGVCTCCGGGIAGAPMAYRNEAFSGPLHFGCLDRDRDWCIAAGYEADISGGMYLFVGRDGPQQEEVSLNEEILTNALQLECGHEEFETRRHELHTLAGAWRQHALLLLCSDHGHDSERLGRPWELEVVPDCSSLARIVTHYEAQELSTPESRNPRAQRDLQDGFWELLQHLEDERHRVWKALGRPSRPTMRYSSREFLQRVLTTPTRFEPRRRNYLRSGDLDVTLLQRLLHESRPSTENSPSTSELSSPRSWMGVVENARVTTTALPESPRSPTERVPSVCVDSADHVQAPTRPSNQSSLLFRMSRMLRQARQRSSSLSRRWRGVRNP
mmetsp:Transcript_95992/g.169966  ORF Transcript_95992/g.169966 Transcript_95992/m.169966 type:complete len:602 (+) Transcript_95992:49-1854(+)